MSFYFISFTRGQVGQEQPAKKYITLFAQASFH